VNYLGDNNNFDDDGYWDVIEVSKISDKIIERLLDYLKNEISDNFFISFESVLKLGNKIPEWQLRQLMTNFESNDYKKDLFKFIIDFANRETIQYHLLPQLYSSDFIIRARTIMKIKENDDKKYVKFLLPLIDDPDDSVRWSVIDFLVKYKEEYKINSVLINHLMNESNPIIHKKLESILK
jgi:HEAT repeat protein